MRNAFHASLKCSGAAVLVVMMLVFAGCHSPTSAAGVRANFSPELHSTANSYEQHLNREARTRDMNLRGVWDDGSRLLLLDRPSRLSPYPIP
ncbi:hypothetical protein ACERK3_10240 [Phycisphaerales bacterium AB-hyl4]|uniref:Uncharacterized protein n=1 Tax=Natronomicrosphaera hydrolytica TaxID=3242702 RepID=A0ABV4U678_9BACT